jgi:uncharacterized repeat protein (TIGR03803 family)
VFSINPDGSNYNKLYSLGSSGTDGTTPQGALINVNGVLYGTASRAGTNNGGTVFSINFDGSNYSTLYSFGASGDGISPQAALLNVNGVLYSTTAAGGSNNGGTVFSIYPNGSNYNILYSFGASATDGVTPSAALINVNDVLYSITAGAGAYNGGTVFSIYPDGSNYNILYSFGTSVTDGTNPQAALLNVNNVLYGTTSEGGRNNGGTVFGIDPNGNNYNTLYSFGASDDDGTNPYASLLNVGGALYGTTPYGGASSNSAGTLFKLQG